MPEEAAAQAAPDAGGAGGSEERYINDVMADNAEFDQQAGSQPFDPAEQASALLQIFDDPTTRSILQGKLAGRFEPCAAKLNTWRPQPPAALGAAVEKVVVDLSADHLRPSGMLQRLRDGVDAASFGVATLLTNLPPAAP